MNSSVPGGWKLLPIGDVTAFSQGIQVDVEQHHEKEGDSKVRFVRISDYTKSHEPPRYIDSSLALKGLVEKDDVVMIRYGEAGRVCRGIVGAIANNLFTIRPNSILEKEYLFQYLTSKEVSQRIGELAASSAMPAISFSSLKSINLTVPPLPEQKKIASILTSVDEVIENTQKQIDKLQDLKKATMNELLTKGIGHTEFKDSELGRIPKSWDVLTFSESDIKVLDGDRGNEYPKEADFKSSGFCLFLSAKNVTKNGFRFDTTAFITKDKDERLRKGRLNPQDIVITTRGTVGNIAFYDDSVNFNTVRINSGMAIIRNNNAHIECAFIYKLLSSGVITTQLKNLTFGSAQPQLTIGTLNELQLPIPPLAEQSQIVSAITSIQIALDKMENKISQTKSLKKSLMQDLLTGKVRVTVN
ncbi:restriction endonuclease subunit S [Pseudomonadales bacterium]|nr:restriction endonuclease subunit S [Pseudomonadales bacterium]